MIGDEKYECVILKSVIIVSSSGVGSVNWVFFRGFVLDNLYLYLWYNQTIMVSKFWMGGFLFSISGTL